MKTSKLIIIDDDMYFVTLEVNPKTHQLDVKVYGGTVDDKPDYERSYNRYAFATAMVSAVLEYRDIALTFDDEVSDLESWNGRISGDDEEELYESLDEEHVINGYDLQRMWEESKKRKMKL